MSSELKFTIIIPARYASSRFPGKPLAKLGNKEVILHVCEQAGKVVDSVVVATDDLKIKNCVESAGYTAVMTSTEHRSGTDRVNEAYSKLDNSADVIINIQGDEPFIQPQQITELMQCFKDHPDTQIATLARPFNKEKGFEALFDSNLVKVTFSKDKEALYFSRSIIPYIRNTDWKEWLNQHQFYTHVGIYAYRSNVLSQLTSLPQSPHEKAESLEQLRWLENGFKIRVGITEYETIGIDTPDDLKEAEKKLSETR